MKLDRELVLLGAGASVDAGLPTAAQLPDRLREVFRESLAPELFQQVEEALRLAEGIVRFGRAVAGGDSGGPVNIEELIATIDLIANRHEQPLAPFVGGWHPRVVEIDNRISETLDEPASGVRGFGAVGRFARQALPKLLWLQDSSRCQYLLPLVRWAAATGNPIATLNYDNAIERACELAGIPFESGAQEFEKKGSFPTTGSPNHVLVLKLHGSLNWFTKGRWFQSTLSELREPTESANGIIFATARKFTPESPYFDLMCAFKHLLTTTKRLTVLGYSYGDEHINEMILQRARISEFLEPSVFQVRSAGPSMPSDPRHHRFLGQLVFGSPSRVQHVRTRQMVAKDAIDAYWPEGQSD